MTGKRGGALIVGGGTGLGFAAAESLARRNWRVFLTSRREEVLQEAARKLPPGSVAGVLAGDATKLEDLETICAAAAAALGALDAVVISSGLGAIGSVLDTTAEDLLAVFSGNVLPVALTTRAALPFMPDGGSIIAIASIAATVAHERRLSYSTAKAAVLGMVKQMALDLAPRRIRVNALSPSLVLTDLSQGALSREADPAKALAKRLAQHPLGRLGEAQEMGEAVAFLAGAGSAWMTGQNLMVDGGLSL
jgi:NAD(P)-dependent dehydrogenase (short-subunit alcohol dehydrogenase family)